MPKKPGPLPSVFFTPDRKHLSLWAYLFLFLLCVGFFTPGYTSIPPMDRDESSFAQASKQMIENGNYVDIRLQDEPRYKKPVGIYWLQVASVRLLNAAHLNEIWAYRVPSFISGVIAVLMTAALGTLLFGPAAGLLAAIMMAGCIILNVEARLAKTDATLLACVMVAQYAMARAYLKRPKGYGIPFAFWTAIGIGILVKGPIILLVVLSTLLWLRVSDKNLKWFAALKPWAGIPYAMILTLPWLVVINVASHGRFFEESAGHDMLGKITHGEYRGIMLPGSHLLAFSLGFFPFSLFGFLAVPDSWKNRREATVRFCLGWIVPVWIVFELSMTKLPHYVMPTYPAIAMLAAKALNENFPVLAQRVWRWLPPLTIGLWLMTGTMLALTLVYVPYMMDHTWNTWQAAAGAMLLAIQGASLFFLFKDKANSVLLLAAGNMVFMACAFGLTLPELKHLWLSRNVVEMAGKAAPCGKIQIISATYNEPSFIFTAGTKTEFTPSGALAAQAIKVDPCKIALIDDEHMQLFLDAFSKTSYKPVTIGTIEGFNTGSGRRISMALFTLPQPTKAP